MFDEYILVDQIPENDSDKPAIHIFTRPFDLSSVKHRDSLNIYTTAALKSVMIYDHNSEIRENVIVLNDGDVGYSIELPNKKTIWIKTFSCNSKSLNVVVLFEYCSRYTLYAGRFIATNSDIFKDHLSNKSLRKLMQQKQIDDLYIDATTSNITEMYLQRKACDEIESLVKSNTKYKFDLLVNDFGYEDLIYNLAMRGITVCLDSKRIEIFKRLNCLDKFFSDPNDADVILSDQLASDTEQQFKDDHIISIKLSPETDEPSSEGLRIVKFSVHPTFSDIHYIVNIAAPLKLYAIGYSVNLPFDLTHMCRYDENDDKENI